MPRRPQALEHLDWSAVEQLFRGSRRFVLTTHVRADTDGIGSEIALHRHLVASGRTASILNSEALPPRLAFLDEDRAVRALTPASAGEVTAADVIVVLDVSELDRLGALTPLVRRSDAAVVILDHHVPPGRVEAELAVCEPAASSTGVIVYDLLLELGACVDRVLAQALYATIVADTGSFRFSNTSPDVLRVGADLLEQGVDPLRVYRGVLGSYSAGKLELLSRLLGSVRLECHEQLAWVFLPRSLFEETGTSDGDLEGLIEYLRLLERSRLTILMVEAGDGTLRASFRSEGDIDVCRLARTWGGGGHVHAAGAQLPAPVAPAMREVVDRAKALLGG